MVSEIREMIFQVPTDHIQKHYPNISGAYKLFDRFYQRIGSNSLAEQDSLSDVINEFGFSCPSRIIGFKKIAFVW